MHTSLVYNPRKKQIVRVIYINTQKAFASRMDREVRAPIRKQTVQRRVLTVLFFSICLAGCLYQIGKIGAIYFSYTTVTAVTIDMQDKLKVPAVSICVHFANIIDISSKNLPLKYPEDYPLNIYKIQDHFTLKEIFNLTPSKWNMFADCQYRRKNSYDLVFENGSKCYDVFAVSKFFTQDFMCYRIRVKVAENATYKFHHIANSYNYNGMFYDFRLNYSRFAQVGWGKAVINSAITHPYLDVSLSPMFGRDFNYTTREATINRFDLTYSHLESTRLPPPYKTNCREYSKSLAPKDFMSAAKCFNECIKKLAALKLGKLPFNSIIEEIDYVHDYKHINSEDIRPKNLSATLEGQANFSERLEVLEGECRKKCRWPDCKSDYYTTSSVQYPHKKGELYFRVDCPREPKVEVVHHPALNLIEFIIYLLSCIGTWLGISVFHLNPIKLFNSSTKYAA